MIIQLKELKKIIKKQISNLENNKLLDDEAYKKKSLLVPDDIKSAIDKWAKDMRL